MKRQIYKSIEEVFKNLEPSYGHQFKEFDINHRLDNVNNKGALGQVVEEGILHYPINSNPDADLKELGIEVKTTGVIETKKKSEMRAKERLTIDSINYNDIVNFDFENSPVWNKCRAMLLVFYQYLDGVSYGDMRIIKADINRFSEEDIAIMENDYKNIIGKIRNGKAETISEGDTMYLGACTAGIGALQEQPFSSVLAKQRKFCIKQSFFTQLVRKYINKEDFEHILSLNDVKGRTFEMAVEATLSKYYGKTESELISLFKIKFNDKPKQRYERCVAKMLNVHGDINQTEEFVKAGITLKTIRVTKKNLIEQSMSFPYFDFCKIFNQEWEDSDIYDTFVNRKFMLAIFKEDENGVMHFERTMLWNMPLDDLEKVHKAFDEVKEVLSSGNIISKIESNKKGKMIRFNNFPGMADNPVAHVRPHGKNKNDVLPLPVPDKMTGVKSFTKQCFWLNNSYVEGIIGIKDN